MQTPERRMDTACIRILEPDTAFSQVSVSAYTNQLSIRTRIHTLPEYPHTGAVCGYNTHISVRSVPPIILPYVHMYTTRLYVHVSAYRWIAKRLP